MCKKTDNCIIFPHIPKCFGTSLFHQFRKSDLNVFFDYDHPPHYMPYFQQNCLRRNNEYNLLNFQNFDLVFGHFPIERYTNQNYQYVTLLRHPIDRAVSHFFYWKYGIANENREAFFRHPNIKAVKNGEMGLIEFIEVHKIDKLYSIFLNNKKPSEFLLVGFTDHYKDFLCRLSDHLNLSLEINKHIRKGQKENIESEIIEKAEILLKNEIDLYKEFYRHWN